LGFGAFPLVVGLLNMESGSFVSGLILALPGFCLFSAGVLGLVARPAYKGWRAGLPEAK
jgi:hypothetical protein